MLTKKQFVEAMKFFDEYEKFQDRMLNLVDSLFEGNGLIFTGSNPLYNRYLKLLQQSMNLDPDNEFDPISYYLYESDYNIYDIPDENGLCKVIGKKDYKSCVITFNNKQIEIKNAEDLYDYILMTM